MDPLEFERKLRDLKPGACRPKKCCGDERRDIVKNDIDGQTITVRTGVETEAKKKVSYDMMRFAFGKITNGERFESGSFRKQFRDQYRNGACIYSTVGGILVEWKLADRFPCDGNSCYYEKAKNEVL
jgi:hypothetical protein